MACTLSAKSTTGHPTTLGHIDNKSSKLTAELRFDCGIERFDAQTRATTSSWDDGAKVYIQGRNLGMLYSSVDFMDLDTGATHFNRGFTFGLQLDF